MTGVSPVSCGGAIGFPAYYCEKLRRGRCCQGRSRPFVRSAAAPTCIRMRTPWTPGSRSALWPFSTLGWPDKTEELKYFYPTSTLVTGYDIIFFWVARMIFSGLEHMGDIPFNTVFVPRSGPRCPGQKDEQIARQRHRPAGDHRPVRCRRAALHPCHRQQHRATICASAMRRSLPAATLPTRFGTLPALF